MCRGVHTITYQITFYSLFIDILVLYQNRKSGQSRMRVHKNCNLWFRLAPVLRKLSCKISFLFDLVLFKACLKLSKFL
jgi:hypothetical protein